MANIHRMADEGALIAAGPLLDGGDRTISKRPDFRDGMVRYQLGLLKSGPRRDPIPEQDLHALRHAHGANVTRLLRSGAALLAGPIENGGELQGIFVFRGDSAEAASHAATDPEVKAGWLHMELHPWIAAYGTMPGDRLAP